MAHAERNAAWLRLCYPAVRPCTNDSVQCDIVYFDGYQFEDDLLEDMGLPIIRGGGNWANWLFKIHESSQLTTIGEERRANRAASSVTPVN